MHLEHGLTSRAPLALVASANGARAMTSRAIKKTACDLADLGARLRIAREVLGLTQAEVAIKCGVSEVMYRKNEKGLNQAGICLAGGFVAAGINANWLMSGEGPMLLRDLVNQEEFAAMEEQPMPPAGVIDAAVLELCIRAILEAHHKAAPDQIAHHAIEFYQRLMDMETGENTAAA